MRAGPGPSRLVHGRGWAVKPGFPAVDQIENVGVYPDIVVDYMTRDNLMTGGKAFVQTLNQAVADLIAGP